MVEARKKHYNLIACLAVVVESRRHYNSKTSKSGKSGNHYHQGGGGLKHTSGFNFYCNPFAGGPGSLIAIFVVLFGGIFLTN